MRMKKRTKGNRKKRTKKLKRKSKGAKPVQVMLLFVFVIIVMFFKSNLTIWNDLSSSIHASMPPVYIHDSAIDAALTRRPWSIGSLMTMLTFTATPSSSQPQETSEGNRTNSWSPSPAPTST